MNAIEYRTSFIAPYLKGNIGLENQFLTIRRPTSLIGLIPMGERKESIPIFQLSSVESEFRVNGRRIASGILLLVSSVFFMMGYVHYKPYLLAGLFAILFLICLLSAPVYLLKSVYPILRIKTTSGSVISIRFLFFEKQKSEEAYGELQNLIAMYTQAPLYGRQERSL
ncbi:MAG: hypothetical protein IJU52_01365 [Clostridia bacterium]|nr:hypothetical protein [Clostridia bacterium]